MNRFVLKSHPNLSYTITRSNLEHIRNLRMAVLQSYNQVYFANNNQKVIDAFNLLPTIVSFFTSGVNGGLTGFAAELGKASSGLEADRKMQLLNDIDKAYVFFNTLKLPDNVVSLTFSCPMKQLYNNDTKAFAPIWVGTPYFTSRTYDNGVIEKM